MDMSINGDEDYENYTMTLQFDKQQVAFLSEKMSVRAYAKLKDGSVIYSKTQSTSIYDTADYLYTVSYTHLDVYKRQAQIEAFYAATR